MGGSSEGFERIVESLAILKNQRHCIYHIFRLMELIFLLVGLVLVSRVAVWLYPKFRISYFLKDVPGPRGIFGLGILPWFLWNLQSFYDYLEQQSRKYGDFILLPGNIFLNPTIVTTQPKHLEHVLQTNYRNYIKPSFVTDNIRDFIGNGIFATNHHTTQEHKQWHFQRKLIARFFSRNNFRFYCKTIFNSQARNACDSVLKNDAPSIDMQQVLLHYITGAMYHIGLGTQVEDVEKFQQVFSMVSQGCVYRMIQPWYKHFGAYMPSERRIQKGLNYINAIVNSIIQQRLQDSEEELVEKQDILSYFLLKRCRETNPSEASMYSESCIRDLVFSLIGAGSDSSASLLTWALFRICETKTIQAAIVEEVDQYLQQKEPSYDDLKQLSYLEMVIQETLRLHPPIPLDIRKAVADDFLPDGTFIPEGTQIQYSSYTMGRDPARWKNPLVFNPDRWRNRKKLSAFEFPVFHAGVRRCPGEPMALMEVKLILAMLFQRFHFELSDPFRQPTYEINIGLMMKGGLHVRATPRHA